eukprot:420355-Rhodomonas_salina.2
MLGQYRTKHRRYLLGSLPAVHDRHIAVHEDQVKVDHSGTTVRQISATRYARLVPPHAGSVPPDATSHTAAMNSSNTTRNPQKGA